MQRRLKYAKIVYTPKGKLFRPIALKYCVLTLFGINQIFAVENALDKICVVTITKHPEVW